MTLITSATLRATLVSITSFVLITRPADWKATLVASYEQLSILLKSYFISTNSTAFCLGVADLRLGLPITVLHMQEDFFHISIKSKNNNSKEDQEEDVYYLVMAKKGMQFIRHVR